MEHDLKPLREKMVTAMAYDGWQFVQNAIFSIDTARYCVDIIGKIIRQHEDTYNSWFEGINQELIDKREKGEEMSVSITSDNLPHYSTKVADMDISSSFLLQKLTNDFFQYTRNTFDYLAQIANASCLRERGKKTERVDFTTMNGVFAQQSYSQEFPDIHSWFDKVGNSQEYSYLDDFCNRTKHICDIHVRLSMPFFGGESTAVVNPFFKKDTSHPKQDMKTYLEAIYNYAFQELSTFLSLIETEIDKMAPSNSRFHQLLGYQQIIKDSPENSFAYAYIEAPGNDAAHMPEEIGILLLQQDHEDGRVDACNCNLNNIYITNPADKFDITGVYQAETDWQPDQVLFYRKYKKFIPAQNDPPLIEQIMLSGEHRALRFYPNPYMTFMSVEA